MCLRHVTDEVSDPRVSSTDDQTDHSILATSYSLSEWKNQFL